MHARAQPELILDLDQIAVVYKPPHWRCELPNKDSLVDDPESRGLRDPLLLLRWVREKLPGIDPKLFEEDFNPAISGTGFGPLAHRIDQETSGSMLVVKTARAQTHLKSQFYKTEISKRYLCLVHGRVARASGVIDASIRTYRTDSVTLSEVSTAGEWAQTEYQVIATYGPMRSERHGGFTLVACDIKSGRTHQIRVHMQHLGHALVSDDKYLSEARLADDRTWCPRLFLHSYRLRFRNMENKHETVVCPLPQDLKAALLRLGAADPTGHASDSLFDETSWQREIFRPPLSQWQPGTGALRQVATLLAAAPEPISLAELAKDVELQRLLGEQEGSSHISKSWLSRNWRYFEAVPSIMPDGSTKICLQLRPAHAGGICDEEQDLERRIEAVRCEMEELQRLKQRAVAEEEYSQASEIKKRLEASGAELASLLALAEPEEPSTYNTQCGTGLAVSASSFLEPGPNGDGESAQSRRKKERLKPAAFKQDVQDEGLFPSLVSLTAKPVPKRAASLQPLRADGTQPGQGPGAKAGSATQAAGGSAEEGSAGGAGAAEEVVLSLKDALAEFLQKKEGSCAHINEVNNDRFLRQVMAAQQPKPVTAVNKTWLKQHEDVFVLLRTQDNEMYVGLGQAVKAKAQSAAAAKAGEAAGAAACSPAYHQVIQKTAAGDAAPPLVYQYSAAARREDGVGNPKDASPNPVATSWQDKFLAALKQLPQRFCSADELLQSVPLFADAMGARKAMEQKELLVLFLEGFPNIFRVERRGSGSDRQYIVWAR